MSTTDDLISGAHKALAATFAKAVTEGKTELIPATVRATEIPLVDMPLHAAKEWQHDPPLRDPPVKPNETLHRQYKRRVLGVKQAAQTLLKNVTEHNLERLKEELKWLGQTATDLYFAANPESDITE